MLLQWLGVAPRGVGLALLVGIGLLHAPTQAAGSPSAQHGAAASASGDAKKAPGPKASAGRSTRPVGTANPQRKSQGATARGPRADARAPRAVTARQQARARGAKAAASGRRAASGQGVARDAKASSRAAARGQQAQRGKAVAGSGMRAPKRRGANRLAAPAPSRPSFAQVYGLHETEDALDLKSSVALVVDQETDEVLFSKNSDAVLPIASITKLMTALVVTEAGLPLDEMLAVGLEDVAATAGSRSRLQPGTRLSRGEMLHLALMSSENRAAHVLGRTYPGGPQAFVAAMNRKARELGMNDTRYVEPTGLSADNQSSARDLTLLVRASMEHPLIGELSTMPEASVPVGRKQLQFRNTNGLVRNPEWEIGVQKTGYIAAAGRCVVMQAELAGRKLIMVLLDSAGRYSRIGDAERLRKWIAETHLGKSDGQAVVPDGIAPSTLSPGAGRPVSAAAGYLTSLPTVGGAGAVPATQPLR